MSMEINIRPETFKDYAGIKKVNDLAFNQPNEGILIEKLRSKIEFIKDLSLVAELNGLIVGHILFFPIKVIGEIKICNSLSLAPMSVLPGHQRKGIGSQLVIRGIESVKKIGFKSIIVLGHKDYYPKFGFTPASNWKITSPFEVPDEAFMALELAEGSLKNVSGLVEYPPEFDEVGQI